MSKVNLFKKIAVSAITVAMCLCSTLSASASTNEGLGVGSVSISPSSAEWSDTCRSYLSDLQPYINELQSINDEFGYGIEFYATTEDDVLWAHSEYCSMTIPEFRNYVVDLYNTNYANYDVPALNNCIVKTSPDYAVNNTAAPAASGSNFKEYTATQRIYISDDKPDNYFWIESTQYSYTIGMVFYQRYKSFDAEGYYLPTYPTWRPYKATEWSVGDKPNPVTFKFHVKWYLSPTLAIDGTASHFSVQMSAGQSSVSVNLRDGG